MSDLKKFMADRHAIYLARQAGAAWPWTGDVVLRDNRFCNIFRELDTVTIWVRKNIREPFADHPHLWFMLAIARYINWPETLETLMAAPGAWPSHHDFSPENMTAVLEARASFGEKVYTGAYMIRAESSEKAEWYSWTKHRYIAEIVLGRLWEDREKWETLPWTSLELVWERFQNKRYIGWGPFMAYEVVTDLRHTRYLRNAPDIYTWANAGPGALRGLNRVHGRWVNAPLRKEQATAEMKDLMERLNCLETGDTYFNEIFGTRPRRFEMRDVEHTLCEYDKYVRVLSGEGKMRSKYRPEGLV